MACVSLGNFFSEQNEQITNFSNFVITESKTLATFHHGRTREAMGRPSWIRGEAPVGVGGVSDAECFQAVAFGVGDASHGREAKTLQLFCHKPLVKDRHGMRQPLGTAQ